MKVDRLTTSVPTLKMPPPRVELFPVSVLLVRIAAALL
jgi:hypothetical protein